MATLKQNSRIEQLEMVVPRNDLMPQTQSCFDQPCHPRRRLHVAHIGLQSAQRARATVLPRFAQRGLERLKLEFNPPSNGFLPVRFSNWSCLCHAYLVTVAYI